MVFHVTLEHAEDGWIVAECPAVSRKAKTKKMP